MLLKLFPGQVEKSFINNVDFVHETSAVFQHRTKKNENFSHKKTFFFFSKRSCGHEKCCVDNTPDNLSTKVPKTLFKSPKREKNRKISPKQNFSSIRSSYAECSYDHTSAFFSIVEKFFSLIPNLPDRQQK